MLSHWCEGEFARVRYCKSCFVSAAVQVFPLSALPRKQAVFSLNGYFAVLHVSYNNEASERSHLGALFVRETIYVSNILLVSVKSLYYVMINVPIGLLS